jgi:hypothetical protein
LYCLFVEAGVVGGVSGAHPGDAVVERGAPVHRVHDAEAEAFNQRSLSDTDYVYVWVDGMHLKVCLEKVAR